MRWIFTSFLALLSSLSLAQKITQIETFPLNAQVYQLLEGTNNKAILVVDKVTDNPYNLNPNDTILADFYFTTQAVKGETQLCGIKAGDRISVRMSAKRNPLDHSYQFTAYHYKNRDCPPKENWAAQAIPLSRS